MHSGSEPLATHEEQAEYDRLYAWRARWGALASEREPGRLQSRQERIERRALACNAQIKALMRRFDVRVGNTINPVDVKPPMTIIVKAEARGLQVITGYHRLMALLEIQGKALVQDVVSGQQLEVIQIDGELVAVTPEDPRAINRQDAGSRK
jgi:hypothetical protein